MPRTQRQDLKRRLEAAVGSIEEAKRQVAEVGGMFAAQNYPHAAECQGAWLALEQIIDAIIELNERI